MEFKVAEVKTDIWMPIYIGDYLADTSRLTTEQHGAYLLLLMDYWRSGKLPNDDSVLMQITKLSPDAWSNAQAVLKQFFIIEDGFLIHKRVEIELEKSLENKTKSHNRAVAAAQARWGKDKDATSNAQAMLKQCPLPSPSPSSLSKPITTITPEGVSDSVFNDFVKLRKGLKAPVTDTAINALAREGAKAGMSLEQVMTICCQNGWRGFKAEWVKDKVPNKTQGDKTRDVLSGLTRGLIGANNDIKLL
jgi:uncharacterized protein YdaU (DUF1376 family)